MVFFKPLLHLPFLFQTWAGDGGGGGGCGMQATLIENCFEKKNHTQYITVCFQAVCQYLQFV